MPVGSFLLRHDSGHSIARPIALRATGSHPSGRSSEKLPTGIKLRPQKVNKRNYKKITKSYCKMISKELQYSYSKGESLRLCV